MATNSALDRGAVHDFATYDRCGVEKNVIGGSFVADRNKFTKKLVINKWISAPARSFVGFKTALGLMRFYFVNQVPEVMQKVKLFVMSMHDTDT